jgi:putative membrane protein
MSGDNSVAKNELAKSRTDLAEDRTVLANERTFASWFRTGLGAVGIGLGFQALFSKIEPAWVPRSIATTFLLLGIFLFVAAERRACQVLERLSVHSVKPFRNRRLRLITIVSSLAVAALVAALWLLPFSAR